MSAKTSTQPGRRTPLSLTGSLTKGQSNKGGGNNAASNSGNNANGHSTTANSNKQDNKLQQQKTEQQKTNNTDTKENPNNNKKAHQQSEKKQQQQHIQQQQNDNNKKSIEKNQNGINNSSKQHQQQQANENKQTPQHQPKDSKQQNGNENKLNENDKKEKPEKEQDKTEKVETKTKEDKKSELEKQENNKKEEKKTKEVKDAKDTKKMDKNETTNRAVDESAPNELQLHEKSDDKNLKDEKIGQIVNPKSEEEKTDSMEVAEEQQQQQSQQKSQPSTPKPNKANKSTTALNKTPTEKTPQKMTFSNMTIKTSPITKREVTTTIDDVDMEPLAVEGSPIKATQREEVANLNIAPSATSTPGKILLSKRHSAAPKSELQLAMQSSSYSPERPRGFSQISGRKSIRPITDYTPSKFHSNLQFRESYRRINTELDVTNTSINVTVGSEVPSNLSFSFFGRGRKRERTPPQLSQSAIGELLHTDVEVSPPKKARLEGFFSAVSSPLTLLRNRFSKATLQSSTPVNLQQKLNAAEDEIEVQNVSGLSIHEDLSKTEKETEMSVASNNEVDGDTGEAKSNSAIKEVLEDKECNDVSLKSELSCGIEQSCEASDIKITETLLKPAVGDPLNKNKRCIVM